MPKSNRPEVRIADQIAIRSFVLGQSLGKIGNFKTRFKRKKITPKNRQNTCHVVRTFSSLFLFILFTQ